jgi:hypothetical protein
MIINHPSYQLLSLRNGSSKHRLLFHLDYASNLINSVLISKIASPPAQVHQNTVQKHTTPWPDRLRNPVAAKVQLSLCLIKHHDTKTYGRLEVQLYVFLNRVPDEGQI